MEAKTIVVDYVVKPVAAFVVFNVTWKACETVADRRKAKKAAKTHHVFTK